MRENIERLAQRRMVVLYDHGGQGFSQRDVSDFSLEARLLDLEAVSDRLDASQIDLFGVTLTSMIPITYAARHPGKVAHLLLYEAAASGREYHLTPERRALNALIEVNWELYVQAVTLLEFGWTELGRRVANARTGIVTRELFMAVQLAHREYDVSSLLPRIECPTLVMHRRNAPTSIEVSKRLATAIPNARLTILEHEHPLFLGEEANMRLIEEFLDEGDAEAPAPELPSGTAIILFADIVDSTGLTERLGDTAFRDKARGLDTALRTIIRENNGTPIEGKLLGDGVLAVFTSARQAIEAALACGRAGDGGGLPLHLGVHAGDVIRGENNVYGGAVNIASRISGLSAPGEVLVSGTVRDLARTSAGVRFEDRGEQALKGVAEPQRLFAVVASGQAEA